MCNLKTMCTKQYKYPPSLKARHTLTHNYQYTHDYNPLSNYSICYNKQYLKPFPDDNLKFDENGSKLSKQWKALREKQKLLVTSNFSFSHSIFKRLVSQGRQKMSLSEKGLNLYQTSPDFYVSAVQVF